MITDFTQNPEVLQLVVRASQLRSEGKRFSDIEDAAGNQYVDLVQEGGGVLGIALVGYTHILENAGIRFMSLAGTSAGAINTLMIAALKPIGEPVSESIIDVLSNKNLFDIVDGDKNIKRLIQKAIDNKKGIGWDLAFNALRIYNILKSKLGVNPGNDFEKWINQELAKTGIKTLLDLNNLRHKLPEGIINKSDPQNSSVTPRIAIITSDITTHTKVEFPRMADLYWIDPLSVNPSKFVRASMSIPFFFEPFSVNDIPDAGKLDHPKWYEHARYYGEVPNSIKFVDGGMLSNFPINVFHRKDNKAPRTPSFGVRLSTYRKNYSKTDSIIGISGAMVSTMRQIHDYDFLLQNPDYNKLICRIDADSEYNWLNFNMTREEQIALFTLGAKKALEFLETFNWEEYKEIREQMPSIEDVKPSEDPK